MSAASKDTWQIPPMLAEVADQAELSPPLHGTHKVDVCIVGGGYLGLWTAIRLLEAEPAISISLVEADICGSGASGRNSGMALPWWSKFQALEAICGTEDALRLCHASVRAICSIADFCKERNIDIEFEQVGWLWGSTCEKQDYRWMPVVKALDRQGLVPFRLLDHQAIDSLVKGTTYRCGAFDASCATIQPAKLARGLKRIAIQMGATVYERTPMRKLVRGAAPVVVTPRGQIRARRVVLAMNAWSLAIPELRSGIFVVSSDDAISSPAPAFLSRHRWRQGPIITNSAIFVSGYRPTADGRIVAGVTGGTIGFGALANNRFAGPSPRSRNITEAFRQAFPNTEGLTWSASWRGPIDRTRYGLPHFGKLPGEEAILFGYGFSGNGIVGCYLGAETLRSLVLGRRDEWATSGLVRSPEGWMPREPMRYIGAHVVRWAVRQKDRLDSEGRTQGKVAARLANLAPGGIVTTRA